MLAQVSAFVWPSMYIWTMTGALVLGSMAQPWGVPLPALVVTTSTWPKGSPLTTVTARQPSPTLVPGPVLMAYRHTVCVPGVVCMVRVWQWSGPALGYAAPTSGLAMLAQASALAWPSMYIWTKIGEAVLGSIAQPSAVTAPGTVPVES